MNIPIYRAKKIDNDDYVQGFYEGWENKHFIVISPKEYFKIDITTLSIHFSDMLDSSGNKIFASLHPKGKGGDILDCRIAINCEEPTRLLPIKYTEPYRFTIGRFDIDAYHKKLIVGIQQ
jgi:hypothetical protein